MISNYINSLPPSSENNDRAIVRAKIASFHKSPSEWRAREVERVTNGELTADFKEDWGNDPKEGHEPHYELKDSINY